MAITLTTPITVPAKSYDKIAFTSINIYWPDINGPVIFNYTVQTYRTMEDDSSELGPSLGSRGQNDLYAIAATRAQEGKPVLATALQAVLAALTELETENGTLNG